MTCTVHVEPMVDPTVGAPAGVRRAWHLAAMLALLATGLWVLGIVAGRAAWRIGLVAAMASCVVPLLAVPLARRVFAVPFPPGSVLLQDAGMVLAAIAGLTLWRHLRLAGRQEPETGCTARPSLRMSPSRPSWRKQESSAARAPPGASVPGPRPADSGSSGPCHLAGAAVWWC